MKKTNFNEVKPEYCCNVFELTNDEIERIRKAERERILAGVEKIKEEIREKEGHKLSMSDTGNVAYYYVDKVKSLLTEK